jgi:heat shock protein HslJ
MIRLHRVTAALTVFLAGCVADEAPLPPARDTTPNAIGTVWQWVGTQTPVERTVVEDPTRYTLELRPDGRAQVRFDCNNGAGSYDIADGQLSFGPLMSTRMACPDDTQDHVFMSQLEKVSSYFLRDGELFLEMPYDSGTMRFRPEAQQP